MFRRSYLISIFSSILIAVASVGAYAQNAPVSGKVELDTNGTKTPVAGALVEVYRTDINAGFPSAKTDKNGTFAFAGMPLGATFVFAISAPGCAPNYLSNVKAGQEKLLIVMKPGDGGKFTEAQIRNVRRAYRMLYRSGLKLKTALEELDKAAVTQEEIRPFVDFIRRSSRSIVR